MNSLVKLGAFLTLVGFLAVGSAAIYESSAPVQDAVQSARSAGIAQGAGWIVVGLGIAVGLVGLGSAVHDLATVVPDIAAAERPKARRLAKARAEFVCSDCGGELSPEDKTCPHCGEPIEDE